MPITSLSFSSFNDKILKFEIKKLLLKLGISCTIASLPILSLSEFHSTLYERFTVLILIKAKIRKLSLLKSYKLHACISHLLLL